MRQVCPCRFATSISATGGHVRSKHSFRHSIWRYCLSVNESAEVFRHKACTLVLVQTDSWSKDKTKNLTKSVKRHHSRKQFLATQSKIPDCKEPSTNPVEKVRRNFQTDSFVTTSKLLPIMSGLQLLTGHQWGQLWKSLLQTKVYLSWVSSRGLTSCRWNPLFPDLRHDWSCSVQRRERLTTGWWFSLYFGNRRSKLCWVPLLTPLHDIGGFKLCFIFQLASHFGGCQTTGDIFVSLRVLPWLILMLTLEKCPSSLERENMYMQCNADWLDSY